MKHNKRDEETSGKKHDTGTLTSADLSENPDESKEYKYVELDQTFWGGENTQKKVLNIVNSHANAGWRLHSFNVITLQGLILFQKQRYCLMFVN